MFVLLALLWEFTIFARFQNNQPVSTNPFVDSYQNSVPGSLTSAPQIDGQTNNTAKSLLPNALTDSAKTDGAIMIQAINVLTASSATIQVIQLIVI